MQTNYINSLTPMRGIAAIWVMLFHMNVLVFCRGFGLMISPAVSGILTKGYLWVDFFFLLSGFIISHVYGETLTHNFLKWHHIKTYLWARFSRIYPLHIFTLLLLIPFALVFPIVSPGVMADGSWKTFFAWSAIFDNLVLINSMNHYTYLSWNILSWSIGAEWWAYFAACFIIPFVFKKNKVQILVTSAVAIAILSTMVYLNDNLDITFNYGWLRCIAEFSLGAVLYQIFQKEIGKNWLSKDILFLFSTILIVLNLHFRWNDLLIIPAFGILLLTTAFNNGTVKTILETKTFKYLGDISYSIYLMHGVWFMVFWFCLPYLKSNYGINTFDIWMKIAYPILFFSLTIVSAHFTNRIVEKKSRVMMKKWILFQKK